MRVTSAMIATAVAISVTPAVLAESVAKSGLDFLNNLDGSQGRPSRERNPANLQANVQDPNIYQGNNQRTNSNSNPRYGDSAQRNTQYGGQQPLGQQDRFDQSNQQGQPPNPPAKQSGVMDKIKTAAKLFSNPNPKPSKQGSKSSNKDNEEVTSTSSKSKSEKSSDNNLDDDDAKEGSKKPKEKSSYQDDSTTKSSATDPKVNIMHAFSDIIHNFKDQDTLKQGVKDIFNSRSRQDDKKSDHYKQKYTMVKMRSDKGKKNEMGKRDAEADEDLYTFDSRDMPMGAMPNLHVRFASAAPYPEAYAHAEPAAEADAYPFADPDAEAYPSSYAYAYAADPMTRKIARRAILRRALSLKQELQRRKDDEDEDEGEEENGE
ncbi:MAG: hypothetical protein LQ340_000086 [Diploschistes diacapsis]|nr:MAG: hypothetical protein LQ340_000086 [Diploschistes diacapsis]